MATDPQAPFAISKAFLVPPQPCKPPSAQVIARAKNIVRDNTSVEDRRSDNTPDPVPVTTLARVLAFEARQDADRHREAYLSSDAIDRFLRAVCRELNRRSEAEALKASVIDLERPDVRAVTFDPSWWPDKLNTVLRPNDDDEARRAQEAIQTFLARRGVRTVDDFMNLDIVFLPRCRKDHWTLNIVWPRKKEYATLNSYTGLPQTGFVDHGIHAFLDGRLGRQYNRAEWKDASYAARPAESSQQKNSTDCGAVLCISAVAVGTRSLPSLVSLDDMERIREVIAGTLVLGDFRAGAWDL